MELEREKQSPPGVLLATMLWPIRSLPALLNKPAPLKAAELLAKVLLLMFTLLFALAKRPPPSPARPVLVVGALNVKMTCAKPSPPKVTFCPFFSVLRLLTEALLLE